MEKKVIKLNESSLNRIIKATAQRIMEEWDSYPEIEGDEFDPENPTAKRYQTDMAWHDLESGALDDPERGLYRKAEQNSEKMHYMKPVGDNPDSWDNVALDEPTNVRDDNGRMSMLAQDDANPFWQTIARNKRDTLRKSRGENFESRNRKLDKAIDEAVNEIGDTPEGQRKLGALHARKALNNKGFTKLNGPSYKLYKEIEKRRGGDKYDNKENNTNPLYKDYVKGYVDYVNTHPEEYLKQTNESRLNKAINKAIKKVLKEDVEQSYDPNMKAIIVGGDLEGEYTIKEIIEKFPIKGYEEQSQNPNLKIKLAGYPKIYGYLGPMWDGDRVRYESPEAYEFFSR